MKSMTGFGAASCSFANKKLVIEVRSVNHKFCEINLRVPPRYNVLERKILELAKETFNRGRVDIYFKDEWASLGTSKVKIDTEQIKQYQKQIKSLKSELKIKDEISLATLLTLPNIILSDDDYKLEQYWPTIKKALQKSFAELEQMRLTEGANLEKAFRGYLLEIETSMQKISKLIPSHLQAYAKKLRERINKALSGDNVIDESRLAQEVVLFADRTDVSEELVRLKSHMSHFREILKEKGPIGRKIDFLLQEINREVNTTSSKSASAEISQEAVFLKQLIEKMREQIQNVE